MQYLAHIDNPAHAGAISETIDDLFVNSPVQTRTMSAKDLVQSLLARIGNIDFLLDSILAAVFFTLLLLVGNALMQSFRERIPEFAILKTLGFTDGQVGILVIGEAVLLCLGAAILGLALAWFGVPALAKVIGGALPHPPAIVVVEGLLAAVLVGIVCGIIPGWKARRLSIIQALAER
jgi:putative ABC transport system permease protein